MNAFPPPSEAPEILIYTFISDTGLHWTGGFRSPIQILFLNERRPTREYGERDPGTNHRECADWLNFKKMLSMRKASPAIKRMLCHSA
jgi:hypothetical protein